MSCLIDADELKKMIPGTRADIFENCRNCVLLDEYQVKELIDNAPTIEAEPVIHGHWIYHPEQKNIYGGKLIECSVCNSKILVSPEVFNNLNETERFCRSCGAKMDSTEE